ncbi:MAG: iron-sulfur cluster assembly scaffold protein [Candidatus Yonathbacteria bacterium]|nr:iron-sulfur cluster assembly scaffold protein [Candidatus Yonathbacteria bacterium]
MNENIYQENIIDHNAHPHNKRIISGAREEAGIRNPLCGDNIILQICFDRTGSVSDVAFQGEGCAISQAGLSMLTDKIKGLNLNQLKLLSPGDIYTMLGVPISPSRANCALLGYAALEKILKNIPAKK